MQASLPASSVTMSVLYGPSISDLSEFPFPESVTWRYRPLCRGMPRVSKVLMTEATLKSAFCSRIGRSFSVLTVSGSAITVIRGEPHERQLSCAYLPVELFLLENATGVEFERPLTQRPYSHFRPIAAVDVVVDRMAGLQT
jgi:hypothetical protein